MSKYTFKQEHDDGSVVLVEFDAVCAEDLFTQFKFFLLGCGFHVDSIEAYLTQD